VGHAITDYPNEACGIIAGKDGVATKNFPTRNGEPIRDAEGKLIEHRASPFRYYIHPEDQFRVNREIEDNDWEYLVIYHSHVASPAFPSPTDVRQSQLPMDPPVDMFPGTYYVLVSFKDPTLIETHAYLISGGVISEETLEWHE